MVMCTRPVLQVAALTSLVSWPFRLIRHMAPSGLSIDLAPSARLLDKVDHARVAYRYHISNGPVCRVRVVISMVTKSLCVLICTAPLGTECTRVVRQLDQPQISHISLTLHLGSDLMLGWAFQVGYSPSKHGYAVHNLTTLVFLCEIEDVFVITPSTPPGHG